MARMICTVLVLAAAAMVDVGFAVSRLGDGGHFFEFMEYAYANNPDGRAFTFTVHRDVSPAEWANRGDVPVTVLGPDGAEIAKQAIRSGEGRITISVPAGTPGVYRLRVEGGYTWLACSLDRFVAGCGDWTMKDGPFKTFMIHAIVPRRWYFFVPQGTSTFQFKTTVMPFQSHKEDYGLILMSPKGQRMAGLFGGKPREVERTLPNDPRPVVATIEVDPGTDGRFWSIWACGGNSHNYSDLQVQVTGVPPYFAPTPEQWFDPSTGKPAPVTLADEIVGPKFRENYCLFTVAPFLGDLDYNGIRGPATIFISNRDNRKIDFYSGSYFLPAGRFPITYRVTGPRGAVVAQAESFMAHSEPMEWAHVEIPPSGAGTYRIDAGAEHWLAWSEPSVPMVLAGKPTPDGGHSFPLEIGIARNWFFKVPPGVRKFGVKATVADPAHVLQAEVHAPDRLMDLLMARGGRQCEIDIDVPDGLDGKIWFLRLSVGSATRFLSEDIRAPRHVRINADLELRGVPGYLSPTWEQWFEVENDER
ncbi:MAG TPA: hypothetical protein VM223_11165 [Planctomycetota bacterium]|nr:hypothetical protein [Planctomycetota bacterium]